MKSGNSFDWLDWLISTVVKVTVGVTAGVVLGLVYLLQTLFPDSAPVRKMEGKAGEGDAPFQPVNDIHQARNREKVDTRINQPRRTAPASASVGLGRKKPNIHTGWIRTIFGGMWSMIGLLLLFPGGSLGGALFFLIPGVPCLYFGIKSRRDMRRYASHLKRIGNRDTISREELAAIVGCSDEQAEKDLRKMAASGYLGDAAYYNDQYERLFLNHQTEQKWLAENEPFRTAPEPEPQKAAPKEAEEGYSGILRSLRRSADAVQDPSVRGKADQLYDITARIFRTVEEHPEKEKQIDTLLSYYLPTTQKLLDSYAQFESAGVEGQNLSQAKSRISETMDMVLKGFSRQLDQLYQADAMDIDSDIRVMETMLRRDTGSVADDFGFGGSAFQTMDQ